MKKNVEQTGLILEEPKVTDRIFSVGGMPTRINWRTKLPDPEVQFGKGVGYYFDTQACVTFSGLSTIQIEFSVMDIPATHFEFLKKNGYFSPITGKIDFSEKFNAILSGTTKEGNRFTTVGYSFRHDGLIPQSMMPVKTDKSWEEWHDPKQITQAMRDLGKQFTDYFDISYSWAMYNSDGILDSGEFSQLYDALVKHPVQIAKPFPGTHAVVLTDLMSNKFNYFDSYAPFDREDDSMKIHYGMILTVTPKATPDKDTFVFTETMRQGSRGYQVMRLQKVIGATPDGIFGPMTNLSVKAWQSTHGLVPDGIIGPKSRAVLNSEESPIISAIIQVESGGDVYAIGDHHLNDKAYGCMQIRQPALDDVNKACGTSYEAEDMLGNKELSIWVFNQYMKLYADGKSYEIQARTWNGGPGWEKKPELTDKYWAKVQYFLGR